MTTGRLDDAAPQTVQETPRFPWKQFFSALLLIAATFLLRHVLSAYHPSQILQSLASIGYERFAAGLFMTLLGYFVMTGYDVGALRFVGRELSYSRIAFASFLSFAFNNSFGLSGLIGGAVRFHLYDQWEVPKKETARILIFTTLSFWFGFAVLSGSWFLTVPPRFPQFLHLPFGSPRILGLTFLLAPPAVYLFIRTLGSRGAKFLPGRPIALPLSMVGGQLLVSAVDWLLAASVLFVFLPRSSHFHFLQLVPLFLLAQFAGLISTIPAGLGVFDSIIILLLSPPLPSAGVFAAVVAFRAVYYLLPLLAASALLAGREGVSGMRWIGGSVKAAARSAASIAPQLFALIIFAGGSVLLFSGVTPAAGSRLEGLRSFVPLPLIEMSHFLASVAGMTLILLSRGLQRRLDAAYLITVGLLGAGLVLSIIKGLDYEEALVLAAMLCALVPARRHFYRRASVFSATFTPAWMVAIALVVCCSVGLGLFSYQHVAYSRELWWNFSLRGDAPRSLRATVGMAGVLLIFALERLLRPGRPARQMATEEELNRAKAIVERSTKTNANLALLGDKRFLFSASGRSFLMYAVQGRSWIAMGAPVGLEQEQGELINQFRRLADRHGGWAVFYELQREELGPYRDAGLALVKLGEEALIALPDFTLEGPGRKWLRKAVRRVENEGFTFELVEVEEAQALMPRVRAISNVWLAEKRAREKSFSLGFFSESYIRNFPLAVVRKGEEIVAFANVWKGAEQSELSVDLMRQTSDAPAGVMDFLVAQLMLWGAREGYRWFNLGVAPLSGLEERSVGVVWHRMGSLAYRHGETVYNFRGLRRYKDKFEPTWVPTYLACPGRLSLPFVLTNLAALISGGLTGVVSK